MSFVLGKSKKGVSVSKYLLTMTYYGLYSYGCFADVFCTSIFVFYLSGKSMTFDHYSFHGFFDAIASKTICGPIEDSDYSWHPI